MTTLVTTERGGHLEQLISSDVSVDRGLLDRVDLLHLLDHTVTKRVTVISAPPGSGKTSLLRAWADRPAGPRRVAFVSVDRDPQNAQQFRCAVLDAIRSPARSIDPGTQPEPIAALDDDEVLDRALSEVAEHVEPVVLIIDDLHELRSADALTQLEHMLAILPSSVRVVLSSRRDPPIRLHRLRLADEIAEIRAGDLRSARGFAITSCWPISCAWSCAERWPMRFLTCTAGPHSGSPAAVTSSRPCTTRWRPATGLMPLGSSRTTRFGGCSTGKREPSARFCRRFLRAHQLIILTWRWLTRRLS
jgi:AAA ATPase domain